MVLVAGCGSGGRSGEAGGPSAPQPSADATDGVDSPEAPVEPPTATPASPAAALFDAVCADSATVEAVGALQSEAITEASGIVASRSNPGVWWTHNDSGDSERVFAIDDSGALLSTVELDGATERDWEDIAIGRSPDGERSMLYVGDTGDNAVRRDPEKGRGLVKVFRFEEPTIDAGSVSQSASVEVDALTFTFPSRAHDVEAMVVDPVDGDLVFITKDWTLGGRAEVFRADADAPAGSTSVLEPVASVDLPVATLVTAADVTSDGTLVALRSYGAVHLFERPAGEPLWAAFESIPCAGPRLDEAQGESLGFAPDGGSYLTTSEGERTPIHRTAPPAS